MPGLRWPALPTITPWSIESLGMALLFHQAMPSSSTVGTANVCYYVPFRVEERTTVTKLWWANGATVSGNIDMGVFDIETGAKLFSTGATAQAGTNAIQQVDITDATLERGTYLMGISFSSSTATIFALNLADEISQSNLMVIGELAAHPLPATATPAAGNLFIPLCGLLCNDTVL